ncbi:MAG: hypothetical protein ABJC26_00075 [Gemmatimonadaceae bacterium]
MMADREPLIVQRVRRRLEFVSMARAISFAAIAAVTVWLAVSVGFYFASDSSSSTSRSTSVPALQGVVALAAAVLSAAAAFWFSRRRDGPMSPMRAALWLEERVPTLHFALATLTDVDSTSYVEISPSAHDRLVAAVGKPDVATPLQESTRRQLAAPFIGAIILLALAMPLHAKLSPSSDDFVAGGGMNKRGVTGVNKKTGKALSNWKIHVVPPAYSGVAPSTLGDIGLVNALVGSRIEVSGNDDSLPQATIKSLTDSAKATSLSVISDTAAWHAKLAMPSTPAEVRFALGATARQLLLEPRADSLPVVRLQSPLADSVYRIPTGTVKLDAVAHDDFGLSSVDFELIVTSGEGERFTAKTVLLAMQKLAGEKDRRWQATMSLDTMKLEAGDIVHMRAVARDRHPDAAREAGTSETRTFRIARESEYDSIAVEPAPPPEVQKSLMSQRMLLIMTEKLEARRPRLQRAVLVNESRILAAEQSRLRKAVGDLVFQRLDGEDGADHTSGEAELHGFKIEQGKLVPIPPNEVTASSSNGAPPTTEAEGDESPLIGINKPLLEAYNAMWDAASALDIADPKTAIPHMKLALAAIERARSAERIYLRGKPPVVIVDVNKVRLAGKDTGQKNDRAAREALSPREAEREAQLLKAALLMRRDVAAATDSLALLRLESLTDAPRFAAALNDALEVARRGGDITNALIRARRLVSAGARADSLSTWRGLR